MTKIIGLALKYIPRPILIKLSYWVKNLLAFYYKGDKFTDPIDGRSYRKLLSYGYKDQKRENALAPGSLSLERHRLLWLYLVNETEFFKKKLKMLHIAPEQCFVDKFREQSNLDYTTADIESPLADVLMDIQDIPFEDNSFDVIFCNHVLEHVEDDSKAMSELYRIMKPGGLGIFQIPQDISRKITYEDNAITDPKERAIHFGQYDHLRVYGLDYFDKLKDVGFKVNAVKYSENFNESEIKKFSIVKNEILPICTK